MYKVGDLFAGIGGVALGFELAGMSISWANEIDAQACKTYRTNFDHHLIEGDIHHVNPKNLSPVDILCAGFPCQAFSIAGYRKGFEDHRGNLFFEVIRFAEILQPEVIFLENVKNLKGHDGGNTYKVIESYLKKYNYHVKSAVLNTCEYSEIPQNRERIYIVAFKNKLAHDHFKFPRAVNRITTPWDLIDDFAEDNFYYNNSKYYPQLKKEMINKDSIYQWRRIYVRENKSGVCPTLTANMGTGGHNVPLIWDKNDIRKLTPRECFRFQGFPDSYKFPNSASNASLYKQAGNSVSVPIIKRIADNIRDSISKALPAKEKCREEA